MPCLFELNFKTTLLFKKPTLFSQYPLKGSQLCLEQHPSELIWAGLALSITLLPSTAFDLTTTLAQVQSYYANFFPSMFPVASG